MFVVSWEFGVYQGGVFKEEKRKREAALGKMPKPSKCVRTREKGEKEKNKSTKEVRKEREKRL
jgi:hypothetical protein